MKLKNFVEQFICKNSLVRLWYPYEGGHRLIAEDIDDVSMEWEIVKEEPFYGENIFRDYVNHEVKGITDIVVGGKYSEAINIVIECTK